MDLEGAHQHPCRLTAQSEGEAHWHIEEMDDPYRNEQVVDPWRVHAVGCLA